ncbi:peptidoglycan-binding protein [Kitasatospora sp. NPDC057541]|uniref:peptidoglycan-binding domain-containing protein n=1 Tax=unclassified Kitasatospora TaxID=2633591 RepID=UPI003675E3C9
MIKHVFRRGAVTLGAAAIAVTSLAGVAQASTSAANIKPGQHSRAVSCVQAGLNRAGYSLAVDGQYGNATYAALTDFQSRHGLSADGIVGRRTGDVLYNGFLLNSGDVVLSELCYEYIPTSS